jgi:hypothetical protein
MGMKPKRNETAAATGSRASLRLNRGLRKSPSLVIAGGEPDLSALYAVGHDWLIPLLVDKFIATRGRRVQPPGGKDANRQ